MADDEFGDASFLDDFDVDAVVASHSQPPPAQQYQQQPQQVTPPSLTKPAFSFSSKNTDSIKNANKRIKATTTTITDEVLETSLQKYFGFESFRPGQKEVLQALLQKQQDAAVFWATGNGKSLCYQLPALVTGKITICISPLISLMQDQVRKLNHSIASVVSASQSSNGKMHQRIATYLGSAQRDPQEEQRALDGQYLLVYLTPEKLLSKSFLDALENLSDQIGLVAFDEAHCVSQWGHDFRPEYRQAGLALRQRARLSQIPIVALTATAVPSIQSDILQSLQLKHPLVQQQSLDRPNLQISIKVKSSMDAARSAMEEVIQNLLESNTTRNSLSSSTIVYAPTKALVEELASFLQQRLETTSLANKKDGSRRQHLARAYHGGMDMGVRQEIHDDFLTGQLLIVVATTAFGMGIDKPDIRRVIHFGPPKNVEEYYQQIGRAGRDGKPSQCWMYYSPTDFDRYLSDFYIGKLEGKAQENAIASTNSLKKYCLDSQTCRRKALLHFFQEVPPFGERCGTCDTCLAQKTYGNDANRDFGTLARYIMRGVQCLKAQGMTVLLKVLNGGTVEDYRYHRKVNGKTFDEMRQNALPNMKVTNDLIKEVLLNLVSSDYIKTSLKKYVQNGYSCSTTVYSLGHKGQFALETNEPIILPVPNIIRQKEEQQAKKRQALQEKLAKKGMEVPQEELEDLDGPAVRAYSTWFHSLERKEAQGQDISVYDELLQLIEGWRSHTAIQQRMAPAAVMAEHLVFAVAYTTSSLLPGCKVEVPALMAVGVRSSTVHELANVLNDWVERNKGQSSSSSSSLDLVPPEGLIKLPKWKYAVYKVVKKTGEPSWMASYVRFTKDKETTQEIAMTKRNRPIQAATVVGHLQEAIQVGYPIDLQRLLPNTNAPTKEEWDQLEESVASRGIKVVGNPETSGLDGGKFNMTDCIRGIMGDELCDKNFKERTPEESDEFRLWFNRLKWFICLKRVGFVPSFGSSKSAQLASDASEYTVPTTSDDDKLMAEKAGTSSWVTARSL